MLSGYTQRALWRGLVASLCVHVAAAAVLYALAEHAKDGEREDDFFVGVDFDLAPVPPAPFEPQTGPEVKTEPEPELKPEPVPEPEPEPVAGDVPDAGVDAATAVAEQDIEPPPGESDAGLAADAGPAMTQTEPTADAGANGAVATDEAAATEAKVPPGANADFRAYLPRGEIIAVQLRFDRLRGTPWAKRVDAVLAPMPDYRMIIGKRDILLADLFDVLLIASSDPSNVTKTHLAAYTETMTPKALRDFLDHEDAPVTWSAARGGILGTRDPSALSQPDDPRVYLMPFAGWTLLARRQLLKQMVKPSDGDVDGALPDPKTFPAWLAKVPSLREQSGGDAKKGPVVVASFHARRERLDIPMVGEFPAPERMSVALQLASTGFLVQGTMLFRTEEDAAEFERVVSEGLARVTGTKVGRGLLSRFHALNAAKGLTLTRRGRRMSYVSSFSTADGKAMLDSAAQITNRFYRDVRGGGD